MPAPSSLGIDAHALRRARLERALTQLELAEKAQVHTVTLSRIETGKQDASASTIRRLAEALGLRPTDIASIREASSV